jgi:hypothetical protein
MLAQDKVLGKLKKMTRTVLLEGPRAVRRSAN